MKKNKLTAKWSKKEKDILYWYPSKPDGHLLNSLFTTENYSPFAKTYSKSFIDELIARGYDITTLKFSVERKSDEE